MKQILSPSILSADFAALGEQIRKTREGGAEYLHFDVMDGVFVPSISFGLPVLECVRKITDQVLDVHLMITEPVRYVEAFHKAGADILTVHYEACKDVAATLEQIRKTGMKAGLSICPDTPVEVLIPYFDQVDMILIMTVNPGFGGQQLIPETLDKVVKLRELLEQAGHPEMDVEVDGGIKLANLEDALKTGANVIVAGSAVFGNPAGNTREFMEILKHYE